MADRFMPSSFGSNNVYFISSKCLNSVYLTISMCNKHTNNMVTKNNVYNNDLKGGIL